MTNVNLDLIGYDPKYYPRANGREDWLTTYRYRDFLLANSKHDLPPIVLVKATGKKYAFLILDGLHRVEAYRGADRETIPAAVERLPESRWFARSVELNVVHGRTLDTGDKAWIAKRLESDGYTIEEAAKLLCMRVESLEKIKAESIVKLKASAAKLIPEGRANRQINSGHYGFLKAPFRGFVGGANAVDVLTAQAPVASMDVLNVLDSAIAVLECGLDMADEDVVRRVERIRALLPELAAK